MGFSKVGNQATNKGYNMHPMIDKSFSIKMNGELITYTIINIDAEGWIKMKSDHGKGHSYLHEDIHRHFLSKLGYRRQA